MSDVSMKDWLVQEISDYLDVGDAGLYEFREVLHSDYPEASEEEVMATSTAALSELRAREPHLRLDWYRWPWVELRPVAEGEPLSWEFDDEDCYMGLRRVDGTRENNDHGTDSVSS